MSIPEQLVSIRKQHQDEVEHDKRVSRCNNIAGHISARADSTLLEIYKYLNEHLYRSCGLGNIIRVPLKSDYTISWAKESDKVKQAIRECGGLEFADNSEHYCAKVILKYGKRHRVEDGEREVILDFTRLQAENERRRRLWENGFRDKLARRLLDKCREYLEECPGLLSCNLVYGIPDEVTFVDHDEVSLFNGHFEFAGDMVKYTTLIPEQLEDLRLRMNLLSNYAEFKLVNKDGKLLITITRKPTRMLRGAYFDYEEICYKYDTTATEELVKVFGWVCDGLKFVPVKDQLNMLEPWQCLMFVCNNVPSNLTNIEGAKRREKDLALAIEKKFSGIHVTDVSYAIGHPAGKITLRILYEILDDTSICLEQQVAAEQLIATVKTEKVSYIAGKIAERLLETVDGRLESWHKDDYNWRDIPYDVLVFTGEDFPADTTALHIEEPSIRLSRVKDKDWLALIDQEIEKITEGVVITDLRGAKKYRLNFDEKASSSE